MIPLLALASIALGAPLDPDAYTSLGTLSETADLSIDTSTASMTGAAVHTGVIDQGIAVFTFDDINLQGLTVTVTGDKPVALLSQGDVFLTNSTIDGSAASGVHDGPGAKTIGPGVGTNAAGGSFGGLGGPGLGSPGSTYGDLKVALEGGTAGGVTDPGDVLGHAGGAVELGATGQVTLDLNSAILADGAQGVSATGAGGGSGGAILVHGSAADLFGALSATGGAGVAAGGGGGGGRICLATPATSPTIALDGGGGGATAGVQCVGDADNDGSPFHLDCDDDDPNVHPGAVEIPGDGTDQNCNGWDADLGPDALQPGDLVISEIMANPDTVADNMGEWFEITNLLAQSVELQGLHVYDLGSDSTTVGSSLVIPANGWVVLGNNGDRGTNGSAPVDYEYTGFTIANSSDEVVIAYGTTVIDEVVYDDRNGWTVWIGTSMTLDSRSTTATDNDNPINWCTSTAPWGGATDLGSPAMANAQCLRDLDGDGTHEGLDCDDNDPVLNYEDEDYDSWASCDGDCDDHDPTKNPTDLDQDGWTSCTEPVDCDDNDPIAQPGDEDGDGITGCDGDCVDTDPNVHPGATEIPDNGLDDDCVGGDEITPPTDSGTATGGTGTGTGTATGTTTPSDDKDKGCGCATNASGIPGWMALLPVLVLVRRREDQY